MSEGYKKLVRVVMRAFYDGEVPPKPSAPSGQAKQKGEKESDLASEINLNEKLVSKVLRHLEQQHLVVREHARETRPRLPADDTNKDEDDAEQKSKSLIFSYSMIDYARFADYTRLRLSKMKRKLKEELEEKSKIQNYSCPTSSCGRQYTAFDAPRLLDVRTGTFKCENCHAELIAGHGADTGTDIDMDFKRKVEIRELLEKFDRELAPVIDQLKSIENIRAPGFIPLTDWIFELSRARHEEMERLKRQNGSAPGEERRGGGLYHGLQSVDGEIPDATQVSVELDGDFREGTAGEIPEAAKPQPIFLLDSTAQPDDPMKKEDLVKDTPLVENSYEKWLREQQHQPSGWQSSADNVGDEEWEHAQIENKEASTTAVNGTTVAKTEPDPDEMEEEWEDV